jgi:predicted permease
MQDLRDAFRALKATPLVTTVAILSLALGIGANTAMFSIVDALVLRQLPVPEADRLVILTSEGDNQSWTNPQWEEIRNRPTLFGGATAWSTTRFNLASGGEANFVNGLWASGDFFEVMRVPAILGRTLTPADDRRDGGADGPVAVISYGYWQRAYGGDASVIGRPITLNDVVFTIVGVSAPGFFGAEVGRGFDVAVPLGAEALVRKAESFLDRRSVWWLTIMARLNPGQSVETATAAIQAVQPQIREATLPPNWRTEDLAEYLDGKFVMQDASSGTSFLRERYQRPLITIMAVVGLVLLIACGNIANLLLARATARRHELSVRTALGASRARLARQLLAESLLLSAAGAAAGTLIAVWGSRLLVAQLSTQTSRVVLETGIEWRMLLFTGAAAVLTALLFGVAPALRAARVQPIDALKEHGRGSERTGRIGLAGGLVIAQVALSLMLVIGAGLFLRTFSSLTTLDAGFDRERVLVVNLNAQPTGAPAEQRGALFERMRDAVRTLPGVAEVAVSAVAPVSGMRWNDRIAIPGIELPPDDQSAHFNMMTPRWFATYGTTLLAGREFDERDIAAAPRVIVVNEAFVRTYLKDRSVLGRTVMTSVGRDTSLHPHEIVGVVEDAVYQSLRDPVPPTMYVPLAQRSDVPSSMSLSVRSTGSPALLTRSVAAALTAVDPRVTLSFRTLADQVNAALIQERLVAMLSGFFGALALLLAGLGLYGVTQYSVNRRKPELGIRMALGNTPSGVLRLVFQRVAVQVGLGIAFGVLLSYWASSFIGGLVYGLPARDVPTMLGAVLVLGAVGVVAAWLPARRAARIDPVAVLREG